VKTMSVSQFRKRYKPFLRCLHEFHWGSPHLHVWRGYLLAHYTQADWTLHVKIFKRHGRGLALVKTVRDLPEARKHINQLS